MERCMFVVGNGVSVDTAGVKFAQSGKEEFVVLHVRSPWLGAEEAKMKQAPLGALPKRDLLIPLPVDGWLA
jgi:hypothetical protein